MFPALFCESCELLLIQMMQKMAALSRRKRGKGKSGSRKRKPKQHKVWQQRKR
jgi:hypothetical protein